MKSSILVAAASLVAGLALAHPMSQVYRHGVPVAVDIPAGIVSPAADSFGSMLVDR